MKKILVILLCMMALTAFASCTNAPSNNEPAPEPTPAPTPEPTPEPEPVPVITEEDHQAVLSGEAYYRLTATRTAKRFALQYDCEDFTPEEDSVLTLKYRTSSGVTVDRLYIRDALERKYLEDKYHAILSADDPYVSPADEDGWISFSFSFPAMTDPESGADYFSGIRLEFGSYGLGGFIEGDYIEIRDFALDGVSLKINPAGEDEDYQSDCGIWNASNTDHTRPTLEVKYFESENSEK